MDRSLPMVESTVPADKRKEQAQLPLAVEPSNLHSLLWTFVLPFRSFQRRKRTTSLGSQEKDVFSGSNAAKNYQVHALIVISVGHTWTTSFVTEDR